MPGHLHLVKPAGPKEPKPPRKKLPLFTEEEAGRLRAALKHARALLGTWGCLASAMYTRQEVLVTMASGRRPFSAYFAIRLARALGKPLESLYRAPTDAAHCPTCGAKRGAS